MELLMERYETLYKILRKRNHKYGCEIGVNQGTTTKFLLKKLPKIERYYTVDPWKTYKMYDGKPFAGTVKGKKSWDQVLNIFLRNTIPYSRKIAIMRMFSTDAVKFFDDEYFDWVYIDANHKYKYIKENLHLWTPKVKVGGLITGHDYENKKEKRRGWGITKAVNEFVEKNNFDLKLGDRCMYWFVRKK
jgi:predicted O-methyltransferase YrrM